MTDRPPSPSPRVTSSNTKPRCVRLMPRYRPIRGETDVEAPALLAEEHASPLSRAPALALSCREADNLGEQTPIPTNRIRSVSAGRAACSHLPQSALSSISAVVLGAARNIPPVTAPSAHGEHMDIAGVTRDSARLLCGMRCSYRWPSEHPRRGVASVFVTGSGGVLWTGPDRCRP